jgi:hypothetical protein
MKNILAFLFFAFALSNNYASKPDTASVKENISVLVIPYKPAMHLSDADPDISIESQMQMPEMRATFRNGLIKELNKNFAEVYDTKGMNNDFVRGDNRDLNVLYHALVFENDSTYPQKYPSKFAVRDTTPKKKNARVYKKDLNYINVGIYDEMLIPDFTKKYNADYLIFINELDIKTHFDDCLNLALKIYRRDLKVHYSIFDKNGKQVYGDVAVSHFESNANDVDEIIQKNFPSISQQVLASLQRIAN